VLGKTASTDAELTMHDAADLCYKTKRHDKDEDRGPYRRLTSTMLRHLSEANASAFSK